MFVKKTILLFTLLSSFFVASQTTAPPPCSYRCVRRNIVNLSLSERRAWALAVRALNPYNPESTALTRFEEFAQRHARVGNFAHNGGTFIPWHTIYLREWEEALRSVDPTVCAHYWDWSAYSPNITADPIWSLVSPLTFGCIREGPFGNWGSRAATSDRFCVWRNPRTRARWPSRLTVISHIVNSESYPAFRRAIEYGAHGAVHVNISGHMAQMRSPNDPVFMLHHSSVERIFRIWQSRQRNPFDYEPSNITTLDTPMRFLTWRVTPRMALDPNLQCATYA